MSAPNINNLRPNAAESLDPAQVIETVYYFSAGFLLLQACAPEHVPVKRGSLEPTQD